MSQGTVLLLSFIGVALLYRSSLLSNTTLLNCRHKKIKVQVSDTTMFNKVILSVTKK